MMWSSWTDHLEETLVQGDAGGKLYVLVSK